MVQVENLQPPVVGNTTGSRNVFWIALSRVGSDIIVGAITTILALQTGAWQLQMMAGIVWGIVIVGLVGLVLIWRGHQNLGMWLIIGGLLAAILLVTLLVSGLGLILAVVAVAVTSLTASQTLPPNQAQWAIIIGAISGVLVIILDLFGPDYRLVAPTLLQNVLLIVAGVLIFIYAIATVYQFPRYSLRTKLIIALLVVSILAVGASIFFTNRATTTTFTDNVGNSLKTLTESKALNIGDLMQRQLDSLQSLALSSVIRVELILANNTYGKDPQQRQAALEKLDQEWRDAEVGTLHPLIKDKLQNSTATELRIFRQAFPDHVEAFVTDKFGGVVAATSRTSDYFQADEEWWQKAYADGKGAVFISTPTFDESSNIVAINLALPVYNDNEVIGILRSTYRLNDLGSIIKSVGEEHGGFRADLVFPNGQMLTTDGVTIEQADPLMALHMEEMRGIPYAEFDFAGERTFASQAPIASSDRDSIFNNIGWTLVTHQGQQEALAPVTLQTRNAILLGLFIAGVSVIVAIALAQFLVKPIVSLTTVARRVTGGDLTARANLKTEDEIGTLAASFNTMTSQLQTTIATLEERIAERTRQLETLVHINQRLSGILDLSDLMRQVVILTKETFNYYHVHIYLLDDKDNLIMTEGYGEVGAKMRSQGHSIPLSASKSLVARAARGHRTVTVSDVNQEPDWLPNPLLPNTRSEIAVPIILNGRIEGVLDVQSEEIDGLTAQDEGTLQTLANQIASVLRNARLFAETQDALYQAQRLQRLYTEQAWDRFVSEQATTYYEFRQPTTSALNQLATPEASAALQQGKTIRLAANGQSNLNRESEALLDTAAPPENAVATPLKLGDKIIGVLGVRDDNLERQWTEDEVALVETISEQMSLAIENARLFEATLRNAWRDRVVSESTASVWSSSDIEEVLKAAVAQLGNTLNASEVVIRLATDDELVPSENE